MNKLFHIGAETFFNAENKFNILTSVIFSVENRVCTLKGAQSGSKFFTLLYTETRGYSGLIFL